ncbi:MAG: hypothetical protein IJD48_00875 [Clostridia bacterium]|nr:hypothetical protein [Clostridia bacterium]
MFENIIEYQKFDGKILSLKRDFENCTDKKTLNKVVSLVKDAQAKLIELENKAKAALADFEQNKKNYNEVYDQLKSLNKLDVSKFDEKAAQAELDKINKLTQTLSAMERSLSYQAENVSNIIKSFDACRNNIIAYKQKYKERKEKVDALQSKLLPEIEQIKKQMLALEKKIDANLLAKYKHLRQDKIFPVFVPLNSNACGGCSMALPAALMNKLKEDGYLECEQCRRYIYIS